MIKGRIKEGFIIFYASDFSKDIVDQLDLLRQVASWYGKVAKLNNTLFVRPNDDYIGHESKLRDEITSVFQLLWLEYDGIVCNNRSLSIKAGE